MATIFSRIVHGEIPSHRIAESADCYAFLDINPMQPGHTLVIPKREEDYFFDLSDNEIASLMSFAKVVASAMRQALDCQRVGLSVVGLEVNHAHLHLIPINAIGDMNPMHKQTTPNHDELADIATRIRQFIPSEYK